MQNNLGKFVDLIARYKKLQKVYEETKYIISIMYVNPEDHDLLSIDRKNLLNLRKLIEEFEEWIISRIITNLGSH